MPLYGEISPPTHPKYAPATTRDVKIVIKTRFGAFYKKNFFLENLKFLGGGWGVPGTHSRKALGRPRLKCVPLGYEKFKGDGATSDLPAIFTIFSYPTRV